MVLMNAPTGARKWRNGSRRSPGGDPRRRHRAHHPEAVQGSFFAWQVSGTTDIQRDEHQRVPTNADERFVSSTLKGI